MMHTIRLPGNFVCDREDRGLPCGQTTIKGFQIECIVDDETLADLVSDADYQATGTDAADRSIVETATRASVALKRYTASLEMYSKGVDAP